MLATSATPRLAATAGAARPGSSSRRTPSSSLSSALARRASGLGSSSSSGSSSGSGAGAIQRLRLALGRPARRSVSVAAQQGRELTRAASVEPDLRSPFLEPLARSFILGVGTGALLEAGHLVLQVLSGSFPGVTQFEPLLVADHITGFAAWVSLYALEAAAVMSVLKRFNFDASAAAQDLNHLTTLPRRMLPGRLRLRMLKRFLGAGTRLLSTGKPLAAATQAAAIESPAPAAETPAPAAEDAATAFVSDPVAEPATTSAPTAPPTLKRPAKAPGANSAVPAPPSLRGRQGGAGVIEAPPSHAKRAKELRDREGYLKNMWYAAALSTNLKDKPVKTQLCGRDMVLFRDAEGKAHCIDNSCPHRGAPLSDGWVDHNKGGHSCVVCPYHGWALDGDAVVRDVPAAEHKGEWPQRPFSDSWPVEERGGFVWVFWGSKTLPADERPPIPFVPELEDPSWRAVYEEIEFDCGHFGVFENAIDMGKPEIRDMQATSDAHCVTATFTIHNKPVNAFWALFQVPEVHVTAKAFLPSTSLVTFELGGGLNFSTFVSTTPISANKSINRFALVRKLNSDRTGIFNWPLWDGMARNAMLKIQGEDKEMVEQLRYDQLSAEANVRADLPQIMFRKLRQQYVDLGYGVPTEKEVPPFASSPARQRR